MTKKHRIPPQGRPHGVGFARPYVMALTSLQDPLGYNAGMGRRVGCTCFDGKIVRRGTWLLVIPLSYRYPRGRQTSLPNIYRCQCAVAFAIYTAAGFIASTNSESKGVGQDGKPMSSRFMARSAAIDIPWILNINQLKSRIYLVCDPRSKCCEKCTARL